MMTWSRFEHCSKSRPPPSILNILVAIFSQISLTVLIMSVAATCDKNRHMALIYGYYVKHTQNLDNSTSEQSFYAKDTRGLLQSTLSKTKPNRI